MRLLLMGRCAVAVAAGWTRRLRRRLLLLLVWLSIVARNRSSVRHGGRVEDLIEVGGAAGGAAEYCRAGGHINVQRFVDEMLETHIVVDFGQRVHRDGDAGWMGGLAFGVFGAGSKHCAAPSVHTTHETNHKQTARCRRAAEVVQQWSPFCNMLIKTYPTIVPFEAKCIMWTVRQHS